jgi:2-polyprenyl-6-hydroxyphenyl methylase/3-demethylubiquinone-9 3-methyltransferase
VINSCARLVKPGGRLFFSTINRNPKAWLLAVIGAEYLLQMLPKGTHEYAKFIRPSELDQWLRAAQLSMTDMTGITYNPLTRTYRLNAGDIDVNYLVAARRDD